MVLLQTVVKKSSLSIVTLHQLHQTLPHTHQRSHRVPNQTNADN